MKYLLVCLAILALFLFSTSENIYSQSTGKINIAVMDLEAPDVGFSARRALSDRLRNELFNTGRFAVMERNKMNEILKEQGFQQTGCTSDECYVEAGRLLGVDRIIAGSVGKVGTIYTVSLRMIDVETGRIMLTKSEDCNCPIEKVLTTSLRNIALKMAGMVPGGEQQPFIENKNVVGQGDFFFKSNPAGAKVFIDDVPVEGVTPVMKEGVPAGTHQIRMKKGFYSGSQTVFLEPNEFKKISLNLVKAKGSLKIITTPFEADVFLDNKPIGKSPQMIFGLDAGVHRLKLSKQGYVVHNEVVFIEGGKTKRLNIKLEKIKPATLKIVSQPPDCDTYINNEFKGKTPLVVRHLMPANYQLKLSSAMYQDWITEVTLGNGEEKEILPKLKKKIGTLVINSAPEGATVFIDGMNKGITPLTLRDVEYGRHTISVSKENYEQQERKIELVAAEPRAFSFNLALAKGALFIYGQPVGANISLNSARIGSIPLSDYKLHSGAYTIEVKAKGYEIFREQIEIAPNQRKNISVRLEKKSTGKAFRRSLFIPGLGQSYLEKPLKSIMFPLLELGSIAGAFLQNRKYNQAIEEYNILRDKYTSAVDQNAIDSYYNDSVAKYDEIKSAEKTRNIFIGAAAAIYLWNVLDAALFGAETDQEMSLGKNNDQKLKLYAKHKSGANLVGICYGF